MVADFFILVLSSEQSAPLRADPQSHGYGVGQPCRDLGFEAPGGQCAVSTNRHIPIPRGGHSNCVGKVRRDIGLGCIIGAPSNDGAI